jgi:hypothetical protein
VRYSNKGGPFRSHLYIKQILHPRTREVALRGQVAFLVEFKFIISKTYNLLAHEVQLRGYVGGMMTNGMDT